jgi:hypothetical protein
MEKVLELEAYIKEQAVKHLRATEGFQVDFIELNVGRALLAFAISEGVVFENTQVQSIQNGADEDDEYTTWHYLHEWLEELDAMDNEGKLPEHTQQLYHLWQREFWHTDDE